jgi:hypothetical protein
MCKCTPEIRTPFCGRDDCLPPGYATLGEWLGISSDAEAEAALRAVYRKANEALRGQQAFVATHGETIPQDVIDAAITSLGEVG